MEEKWAYEEDFVHFDSITGQKFNQRTSHQDPLRLKSGFTFVFKYKLSTVGNCTLVQISKAPSNRIDFEIKS